jgi:hypothetical protein
MADTPQEQVEYSFFVFLSMHSFSVSWRFRQRLCSKEAPIVA